MPLTVTALVKEAVSATLTPLEDDIRARLEQHIDQVTKIGDKQATTSDLKAALADGWTPDYFVGDEADINYSGTLATVREQKFGANGNITLGPATLGVTFEQSTTEQNTGSISGTIRLKRQSRTQGVEYALQALSPTQEAAVPALPDQPAPVKNAPKP